LVLVARRADLPNAEGAPGGWQLPQGGMDPGEDPRVAVFRELEERSAPRRPPSSPSTRIGSATTCRRAAGQALGGRYRGQRQRWFALRFLGQDADIRLDLDPHPEFDAWRWARLAELPDLAVGFKRPIYEALARDFARFAAG
jgi:putative (di)nucleoside polyphosphate hydrolase